MKKLNILVTGSSSGLGLALADMLLRQGHTIIPYDVKDGDDVAFPTWIKELDAVDVLINCAGINHNAWFADLSMEDHQRVMDVNATGIIAMTQALLPQLAASDCGTVINIVSNAANMPMTSSLSYNMSKAAALMATKQMAHELTKSHGITVFSVSPNKLSGTEMSRQIEGNVCATRGWTPEFAKEYQSKALMHGLETPPDAVARMIAHLINSGDMIYLSGCDLMFGK